MQFQKQAGQLTVIPKPNKRTTIPEDFNIEPEYEGISYDLVIDGIVMEKNLKELGRDYKWLKKEVRKVWNKARRGSYCYFRPEKIKSFANKKKSVNHVYSLGKE